MDIEQAIMEQANLVRRLKHQGANRAEVVAAVEELLRLKKLREPRM